jgi:hypothetical protein
MEEAITYNHGQAVRHCDQVSAAVLGTFLGEVAAGSPGWGWSELRIIPIVLEVELSGVFADDLDVAPTEPSKALAGNLT